ncbi:hypothetical protein FPHYL_11897 [Fusarium phyllophilum]|uniref:Uncharacterized protein n=1 Tax=Fusarium phyllophilum TaxID=47803 RepID=A0A8H5ISE1_9HYPO|nr:hypothetical protein FPHYL_11897 [Fusarium phyllophilum]
MTLTQHLRLIRTPHLWSQDPEDTVLPGSEEHFDNNLLSCETPQAWNDNVAVIQDRTHTASNIMRNEDTSCHISPSANLGLLSPAGSYQHATTAPNIAYCASHVSLTESHMMDQAAAGQCLASGDMTNGLEHYAPSNGVYTILPSHGPSTCPLDLILLVFLKSRKEMISNDMDPESVTGPRKPSTRVMVNIEQVDTVHPLSGIMSRVLSTFPSVALAEKLGFFYLMCHTMKVRVDDLYCMRLIIIVANTSHQTALHRYAFMAKANSYADSRATCRMDRQHTVVSIHPVVTMKREFHANSPGLVFVISS